MSILIQSFGGVVATFCIYYADNISKNFAVSISMVLSSLVSFIFFDLHATTNVSQLRNDPNQVDLKQFLVGATVVLLATWLYSTHDTPGGRPPAVKINGFNEKMPIMSPSEARDMSIQIPKTPLTSEDTGTSRPGSPAPNKKRKNDLGYFTKAHD